jgi:rhamnosyltransferase
MMSSLVVSIIIPTKNPGSRFPGVIRAVLSQNVSFSYEVLVVDSGSTDGTLDYLAQLKDSRVGVHRIAPHEYGHGRTRNLGISLTTGHYCVLITHDACPANGDWLANLVKPADANPQVAGVFGRHIAYAEATPFTKRELELHFAGFQSVAVARLDDWTRYTNDEAYRQRLHFFSDNNALMRRSVWEKIPYPDVDFAEDQIWAQKIIEAGYAKAYAHDAIVYHSHNYGLFERLQRSFDESYAFRRLFGYRLCPGVKALARSWSALTVRDLRYTCEAGLWRSDPRAVLRAPLDNLMRLFGHYLGTRGNSLPDWACRSLSRDKRMLAGLIPAARGNVTQR